MFWLGVATTDATRHATFSFLRWGGVKFFSVHSLTRENLSRPTGETARPNLLDCVGCTTRQPTHVFTMRATCSPSTNTPYSAGAIRSTPMQRPDSLVKWPRYLLSAIRLTLTGFALAFMSLCLPW